MAEPRPAAETAHGSEAPTRRVSQMLLGRFTRVFAAVAITAAFVLPGDASGFVPVCYFKALFGLPCPGCGLSRSLASLTHLHLAESVASHPFGVVVFVLLVAVLALSLGPQRLRTATAAWLDARALRVRQVYLTGVAAFLMFGVGRLVLSGLANGWPSHSG